MIPTSSEADCEYPALIETGGKHQMEEKKGFFKRLVEGLTKTRDNVVSKIDEISVDFPVSNVFL